MSSNYVDGEENGQITQLVADSDIAYADGNYDYNAACLSFENEGYVDSPFPDSLYDNAASIVSWACETYDIPKKHPSGIAPANPADGAGIIGHEQVPDPTDPAQGGGKSHHTDPGPHWDWSHFISLL